MRIRGDAATKRSRPGPSPWGDPRMLAGAALVVGSMAAGGIALAAADHTVAYWATTSSVHRGESVTRSDFTVVRAKVPARTAATLVRTSDQLPHRLSRLVWAESMPAGTLISTRHLTDRSRVLEVPVTVESRGLPDHLRAGDLVDVWVSDGDADTASKASKVFSRVPVVSQSGAGGFDGGPGATVVVDAAGQTLDGRVIAAVSSGRVTVVRVG